MTEYYPVYLNLAGKRCVIVGGGTIAQGKIAALRQSGATITLISPDATPGIQKAAQMGDVEWLVRKYRPGDLDGAFIAVAATNVWHVNREIYEEADRLGVLLNVVDDPDLCTFIAPSIVKKGPVTLAISTGGASPALARKLRETLANDENLKWADLAVVLGRARKLIKEQRTVVDPERWQCCITEELLQMAQNGQEEEALAKLLARLLDQSQPDLCPSLGECSPQGCQVRTKKKQKEMVS
ncbi:MAG: bifunctional precorrin-2 dehydrogenase/sirohydrochlorin ferrochelatase [Chloroflexi bacterium]|nr:bifunctional precorrin-2 dehydrogenase/sirohydrochlorin ferrochelatase [Chloroflexota bacterium]MDA1218626.1 bifunctional precorrin-2 dehydrogenase/sirohydrochlorin ferrochelatase [Chloroflexota bacterium]